MSKTVFIYALLCPDTDEVRYVGRTGKLKARYTGHLSTRRKDAKSNWVRSLLEVGKKPKLLVLEEVLVSEQVEAEQKWIDHYRKIGASLTNTVGGNIGSRTPDENMIAILIDIPDELNDWLVRQAQLDHRSRNRQVQFILETASKMPVFSNAPRYTLSSSKMCYNGQHHFRQTDPAMADFCNCGVFVYGEVCR